MKMSHFSTTNESVDMINENVNEIGRYELWTTDSTYGILKHFDGIKYFL